MNLVFICGITVSLITIIVLLFASRIERRKRILFSIVISLVTFFAFIRFAMSTQPLTLADQLTASRAAMSAIALAAPFFLLFSSSFVPIGSIYKKAGVVAAGLISIGLFTDYGVREVSVNGFSLDVEMYGIFYLLYIGFVALLFIYSLVKLNTYQGESKIPRRMIGVVSVIIVSSIVLSLVPDLFGTGLGWISTFAEFPLISIGMFAIVALMVREDLFFFSAHWKSLFYKGVLASTVLGVSLFKFSEYVGGYFSDISRFPLIFLTSISLILSIFLAYAIFQRLSRSGANTQAFLEHLEDRYFEVNAASVQHYLAEVAQFLGSKEAGIQSSCEDQHNSEDLTRADELVFSKHLDQNEEVVEVCFAAKNNGAEYSVSEKTTARMAVDLLVAKMNSSSFAQRQGLLKSQIEEIQNINSSLSKENHDKDNFISIASHQLRTPLSVSRLNLKMLSDGTYGKLSKKQKDILASNQQNVEKMAEIIEELLEAARLSEGTFTIDSKQENLSSLVEEKVEFFRQLASQKSVIVEAQIDEDLECKLDMFKIEEVISNFMSNAIEYSNPKSEITVSLKESKKSISFEVVDTGIGVSEADKKKLFTRFGRGSNALSVRPDGMGLGLYLAKEIIEAHGGKIIFKSKLNQGSTFGFELPIN